MVFLQSPAVYARNLAIQICHTHPNGLANGRHGPLRRRSSGLECMSAEVDVWAQHPTELENGLHSPVPRWCPVFLSSMISAVYVVLPSYLRTAQPNIPAGIYDMNPTCTTSQYIDEAVHCGTRRTVVHGAAGSAIHVFARTLSFFLSLADLVALCSSIFYGFDRPRYDVRAMSRVRFVRLTLARLYRSHRHSDIEHAVSIQMRPCCLGVKRAGDCGTPYMYLMCKLSESARSKARGGQRTENACVSSQVEKIVH
ncbi:hypothetical protein B0H19DRAFT_1076037 [Mycena capillaripes]|nr:hypothetical protein B0H19DRAFT_1076037 [Mycena capillaripes]